MSATPSDHKSPGPAETDLANYARTYLNAYLGAVQSEGPEHPPAFYKNQPYAIEACLMPNDSVCILFERSPLPKLNVSRRDWDYVMSKAMSGVVYMATVYPHEGVTQDDAVARGRRDAIRDIRAIESSSMADASLQLEKAVSELNNISEWMKNPVKMAETTTAKLEPLRQLLMKGGPSVDMLALVDAVRRCRVEAPSAPVSQKDQAAVANATNLMADLTNMLRDVKVQGQKLEEVEQTLRTELHEFKNEIDKKVVKGLGVILATTDRKIDKAMAAFQSPAKDPRLQTAMDNLGKDVANLRMTVSALQASLSEEEDEDLTVQLEALAHEVGQVRALAEGIKMPELPPTVEPRVVDEVVLKMEAMSLDVARVSLRIKHIEDFLAAFAAPRHGDK
jgi:hypothetical protein